jgi:hypothetical protein
VLWVAHRMTEHLNMNGICQNWEMKDELQIRPIHFHIQNGEIRYFVVILSLC